MLNPISLATTTVPFLQREACSVRILDRKQAKSRLKELVPTSEEHSKLQDALAKTNGIVEIFLPTIAYKVDTMTPIALGGYGAYEHIAIGRKVSLQGLNSPNAPLLVKGNQPQSTEVKFEHIVALAGDFYGIVNEAISLPGGTDEEKKARFLKAFSSLEQASHNEVRRLIYAIDTEHASLENPCSPHHCYSSGIMERNRRLETFKPDINDLLIDNSDHFSDAAREAYKIGHALAIKEAKIAGLEREKATAADKEKEGEKNRAEDSGEPTYLKRLKKAYAIDAFACHFLTDLFSAGHIRNQRGELELFLNQLNYTKKEAKQLAGLLAGAQHEKDGEEGLNVENSQGHRWRAYGDGYYFSPANQENQEKVIEATQQSVDEIYKAYLNPEAVESNEVYQLIPKPTKLNPLPLYKIEGASGKLSLTSYRNGDPISIRQKSDFLNEAIPLAMQHLQATYVESLMCANKLPQDLIKAIKDSLPGPEGITSQIDVQLHCLTATFWEVVGLISRQLHKHDSNEIDLTMGQIGQKLDQTCRETLEILNRLDTADDFQPLVKEMKHVRDTCRISKSGTSDYKNLLEGLIAKINTILIDKGTQKNPLELYYNTLKREPQSEQTDLIRKFKVTRWFRGLLDYQAKVTGISWSLQMGPESIERKIIELDNSLKKQIEANREWIEESLIDKPDVYLDLQIEKQEKLNEFYKSLSNKMAALRN